MNNSLAMVHPELIAEWSEKNYPLMPNQVMVFANRKVWWKCSECGNEWQSVIHARVKGTVCPVCADRAVLTGYMTWLPQTLIFSQNGIMKGIRAYLRNGFQGTQCKAYGGDVLLVIRGKQKYLKERLKSRAARYVKRNTSQRSQS